MSKCHIVGNHVLQLVLMCPYLAGVHARNQGFYSGGGGGVQVRRQENTLDNVFFFFFFFYSPELILQLTEGVQWFYYRENYTFQRIQRGPEFSRGRGSNFFLMLISKETHITCDFPGDPNPPPPPPLSIRTCLRMRGRKSQRFHRIFIRRISW